MNSSQVTGGYVSLDGETMYRIANSHLMRDFFMSLVSSSDHWMFVSSSGWLTAGRKDPDFPLFPYYSEDKLADMRDTTGSLTVLRVAKPEDPGVYSLWRPFTKELAPGFEITRNLYKNPLGNRVAFEEVNHTLGLKFRYRWSLSNKFGFVRQSQIENFGPIEQSVELVDGVQNVLPYGTDSEFQLRFSNLGDAYKKCELLEPSRLAIYYLSSIPTDKAEPSEGLKATAIWSLGLGGAKVLLGTGQLESFCANGSVETEVDQRGKRGAYLLSEKLILAPGDSESWKIVANVARTQAQVVELNEKIVAGGSTELVANELAQDSQQSHNELIKIVSATDGIQAGENRLRTSRHQSNVIYNSMRGGFPVDNYVVPTCDFHQHVAHFNKRAFESNRDVLDSLPAEVEKSELAKIVEATGDADLIRIAAEYIPLTFGRRHGDPSRPWNAFSIEIQTEDGEKRLGYQGNWRDIFQNWEALGLAFPGLLRSMIFRFLNASTADGYNPYRVTKDGFDWESPDPKDPWANIGYWSDHQIIYLLKLLESSRRYSPNDLSSWLGKECFVYANVPYRIRPYESIKKEPCETIDFDFELDSKIKDRVAANGADGKLLCDDSSEELVRVSLLEKLLVPALSKMTNFVPDGGIWLNTQRPEWNDANNALVGAGLSVVTLGYLRRWFDFLQNWIGKPGASEFNVSIEVIELMDRVTKTLVDEAESLKDGLLDDAKRMGVVDKLSGAGSDFRNGLYSTGLSGEKAQVSVERCQTFFGACLKFIEHSIRNNRRDDGLYHSYNLLSFSQAGAKVDYLYEMLEGQVAVLSSGLLTCQESIEVLDSLRQSAMYRADQNSYMLYPNRQLARFLDKNLIPDSAIQKSQLLTSLIERGDTSIVVKDASGIRFAGDFRNVNYLRNALESKELQTRHSDLAKTIESETDAICDLYVEVFGHDQFTGRSGTFFGYEGLGSIYWHMVSKLALAAQETLVRAIESGADLSLVQRLDEHYREIRDGIGLTKSPETYGGFPTDPYSHSPEGSGVKQPGMTGQVKEDVLTRFCELGLRVEEGQISFETSLFERDELLTQNSAIHYFDLKNELTKIQLPVGTFAFLVCQVPVIYSTSGPAMTIHFDDGRFLENANRTLNVDDTSKLVNRTGEIVRVEINLDAD